jgi:putative nucleotidyltransferase with HDIG domain
MSKKDVPSGSSFIPHPSSLRRAMTGPRIILAGVTQKLEGLQWESDGLLRIGRMENMEVVLNDSSVSRRHAEVRLLAQEWVVQDLGSSNGTFLNGVRVGRTAHKLHVKDLLQFGDVHLRVIALEEPPPPSATPREPESIKISGSLVKLQVVTRHSWENAVQILGDHDDHRLGSDKRFLTLLRAGYHLCHIASLGDLLHSVLRETVSALNAQRGSILLANEATGRLELRAISAQRQEGDSQKYFSRTLAERCYLQGQSLLCRDVNDDAELLATGSVTRGQMSSIICALLRSPRKALGVLHLDRGALQRPFNQDDVYLADAIAASVSTGIESARLVENQREQNVNIVTALAQAVEFRDRYTAGHTQRVTAYALLLAEELKLPATAQHLLQIGTPLHDIGKIGVSDSILGKSAKLTPDEFEQMKSHTIKGAQILEAIPDFANVIPIVRNHHERWNGLGYPDGLSEEQISPLARIVAVVDAFDAMTSDRPYRPAMDVDKAYAELAANAGTHFDPRCVDAFMRLRPRIEVLKSQEESQLQGFGQLVKTHSTNQVRQLVNGASERP